MSTENRCKKCKKDVHEAGGLSSQGGYNYGVDFYCSDHAPWRRKDYWWINWLVVLLSGIAIGMGIRQLFG